MQYEVVADTLTGIKGSNLKAGDIVNAADMESNIPDLIAQNFIKELKPEVKAKTKKDEEI